MKNIYFTEETRNEGCEMPGMYIDSNYQLKDVYDLPDAIDKLGELERIERNIGCPLEVRCKIYQGAEVFVEITYWDSLDEENKISTALQTFASIYSNGFSTLSGKQCYWKDYQKSWWLKPDKSE